MNQQNKQSEEQKEHRFDPELPKKGLRCDPIQYELLMRCSEKRDVTEWNVWRNEHSDEEIWLEGASFYKFNRTYLKGTNFFNAHLKNADFVSCHIEDANFDLTYIKSTQFQCAFVNSSTSFIGCHINQDTDFRNVSLNTLRIKQETKQLLEYNIRRKNWEQWYKEHPIQRWVVKPFWWISNYGISAPRIVYVFVVLAVVFAAIYYFCGLVAPPGILDNLFIDPNGVKVEAWLVPFRAIHFSIVIMTVGFSSMHANAHSFGRI